MQLIAILVRLRRRIHSRTPRKCASRSRISLGANGILRDEITIEDPAIFEKPWTFIFGYRRMPDYQLLEYICEDNREYADTNGRQKIRIEPQTRGK
jgi:hypothetical protein